MQSLFLFCQAAKFFPLMWGHMFQFCSASLKVGQTLQKNGRKEHDITDIHICIRIRKEAAAIR